LEKRSEYFHFFSEGSRPDLTSGCDGNMNHNEIIIFCAQVEKYKFLGLQDPQSLLRKKEQKKMPTSNGLMRCSFLGFSILELFFSPKSR
jgi:hypothetical protein